MSEIQRVKIVNESDSWMGTKCFLNGEELRANSVDFHVGVNESPSFIFEIPESGKVKVLGTPNIDMLGKAKFDFTPNTINEAVVIIRNELSKHGDFYNGFLASIESSIIEQNVAALPFGDTQQEIAEKILKRIVGDDI